MISNHGSHTKLVVEDPQEQEAPREFALKDLAHMAAPYGSHLCEPATFGLELPYASIGGPGFERLCFHLLLSQGHKPRFFGRSGQAQYGIDLIISDGERSTVYQCKNKREYAADDLRSDLDLFAKKWLVERPDLRTPDRFVLCCAARLDLRGDWEVAKQNFFEEHGVTVEEWHRDTLDGWLRREPDIVADLFGNDVAERFCERDGWNDGLFRPLLPGSGEKDVERYLALRAERRLVHDPATVAGFRQILAGQGLILIEGPSGNGKTMAALDLACSFHDGEWRVFFVSLRNEVDEQLLFAGIKDRCVRPTLFILDDCHRDLATVERAVSRVRYALRGRAYGLVLTAQTAADDSESLAIEPTNFVEDCREQQRTLTITPTIDQYREILARAGPSLGGLSQKSLERLYAMTAHDLAVLDMVLDTMEDQALAEVDLLSSTFPRVLRRYFGREKVYAPNLKALAAIAQFDIAVPMSLLRDPLERAENLGAAECLLVRTGLPARGQPTSVAFIHASAAEMIFRALSWADVDPDWMSAAATAITCHLASLESGEAFNQALGLLFRTRLRLADDSNLKLKVSASPEISARIERHLDTVPLAILSLATFLTRSLGQSLPYADWLAKRLESLIVQQGPTSEKNLQQIGMWLRSLSAANPILHASLEVRLGREPMLRLIRANGTIFELFKILENSTPGFAAGLINALDSPTVAALIDKTIAEGRAIGTLNLALRELAERNMPAPDGRTQLTALEGHLGGEPMLRLIRANGTIFELFKILENSTPGFAAGLINALDSPTVAALIDKTIAERRAIGTLDLALRELAERDMPQPDGRTQLTALEAHLGGEPMLRLIRANGTIFELFKILEYSTPGFAAGLINALDSPTVTALIDKTIAERRAIGTLHLALRELAERNMPEPDGRTQLTALEGHLRGEPMLRLIRANGTIFELFMILKYTTPGFAAGLINALDSPTVTALIDKTIAERRAIGTLNLALRELAERNMPAPDGRTQLTALEGHLGGEPMLRLIRANGTIFELFKILEYSTPGFAAGLTNALDPPTVAGLIDKTIAEGQSIGTLSFSLRKLQKSDPISKAKLERAIGVEGFWRLVLGAGDLNDLSYLLADLTGEFRESALAPDAAPKSPTWAKLACRGGFYAISRFVKDSIDNLPPETRRQFEAAMTEVLSEIAGASAWPDLSSGLAIAEQIAHAPLRAALETAAFERIDRQDIDDLGFDSFINAASGLYRLWQRREALRSDLGRRLWSLLPERRAWPEDQLLFVGGRFLLQIGRSEEISQLDAEKLLLSFSKMPPSAEVEKTLPGPLYLFSWNLFALWYARGKSISDQFAELQSKEFWTRVEDVVAKHAVRRGRNQDKLNVLALAGLLTLLLSGRTNRLTQALRGHITGISWLIKEAEDLTFIPAILALKGLWLIDPHQARFSADRRARLLAKAAEYDERGPAIDFLCDWLRDDRRHRPLAGKDRTGRK